MAPVALTGAGNVTAAESSSSDTLAAAKPANLTDGDLLWAAAYFRNAAGTLSAPVGWTLVKSDTGNASFGIWVKPITTAASEPASYTFSVAGVGSSRCILLIGRITGADATTPIDAAGAVSVYTGTASLVHPSVTAVAADCLLLAVSTCNLSTDTPPTFTADPAMTQVAQEDIIGSSSSMQVAQEPLTLAGATGTRTATMSPSANNSAGFLVTIAAGAEAHEGTATITGTLAMAAVGAPDVDGSGTLGGTLAVTATGTPDIDGGTGTVGGTLTLSATGTADTGIGLPPRPRTRWQLVAGPATGGHELALTEATNRRYTARLNDNSDLSFSLDGRHPQAEQIDELSTDVHLLYSDADSTRILDRCRVGPTGDDIDADAHRVEVTCLDYRAVLDRRRLYSGDTLTYAATDQAEIAWGLVGSTQARNSGDLGIAKGWTGLTPTGILRDRTYEAGDSIGERIQELSELIGGFDWDITPISASALQLDVWHPGRGTDRGVVLVLDGLAAAVRREVNPSDYANAIRYTGASGLTAVERDAALLEFPSEWPQGRWDAVYGDDGLTTQAALNARAEWQLAESQVITPVYTVRLARGGWDGPDHIWLGDTVRLIIPSGRLDVDTTARVHEIEIDLDGDGGETVTLTLGGPRPDFRRWPSKVDRRLKNLERR